MLDQFNLLRIFLFHYLNNPTAINRFYKFLSINSQYSRTLPLDSMTRDTPFFSY